MSAAQGKWLNENKATITTLTNENLDKINTPGFYNAGGGNSVTNKPSGVNNFGMIVVHSASGDYYTQIVYAADKSYRRVCSNGTWGNWSQDILTDTKYTHPTYTARTSGLYKVTVDDTGHVSAATAVTKADITALGIPGQDTNTTYNDVTTSEHGLMTAADKTKLDGIATNANNYTHPTSSGNKHIPSGGSSGNVLRWSADGTAVWGDVPSDAISITRAEYNELLANNTYDPNKYYLNNTYTTMCLIQSMVKHNIKNIIFSSTAAVYGEITEDNPIDEKHSTIPINPYGASKLMSERIIRDCAKAYGLNYSIFRYFNVAGAHEK